MKKEKELLIIPDVHGRRFWEEAVQLYPYADTIFLGDYHDPYPSEKITPEESLENFMNIVEYADNHRDNVKLLLGNHDLHYLCNFGEACRYDYDNAAGIHFLLKRHLNEMSIAAIRKIGGKTILLSHAPVLTDWIKLVGETENLELLVSRLNKLLLEIVDRPWNCEDLLGHISHFRGGDEYFGSPVWADMREINNNLIPTADYSIFGHTQLTDAVITDRWANLDCLKAFIVSEDLSIREV